VRIVLDANVLVAGLLSPLGACGRLLDLSLDGVVELCVDGRILREYEEVLCRPHFSFPPILVAEVLGFLRRSADPIAAVPLAITLPDTEDQPFLEVAVAAKAVLVTGNLRHFPKKACKGVVVVSPTECLELLRQSAV
jgi:putative PIN family toxin of toxin-antitoxin system